MHVDLKGLSRLAKRCKTSTQTSDCVVLWAEETLNVAVFLPNWSRNQVCCLRNALPRVQRVQHHFRSFFFLKKLKKIPVGCSFYRSKNKECNGNYGSGPKCSSFRNKKYCNFSAQIYKVDIRLLVGPQWWSLWMWINKESFFC